MSRVWQRVKGDWDARNTRSLAAEPIVRLILDGTVVRARLDRKATSIVLLVVLGVREDGQKVLLAVKNMGGGTSQAWRIVLDDPSSAGYASQSSWLSTAGPGWSRRWLPSGAMCRPNVAPSTGTATCWPKHRNGYMRLSWPTITT
jgi:hypothetical protein